ncbi:6-carboxytetrahydropterin synthase [Halochromatium sp.]
MTERLFHKAAASFEAARRLAALPPGHPSARLHGHGFKARLLAELPPAWGGFDGAETDALDVALRGAVEGLDYRDLNEQLAVPSDENLALWVRRQLELGDPVPGIVQVGVQSTSEQGVELSVPALSSDDAELSAAARGRACTAQVWRRFRFEAAHQLVNVPPDHQCGRMHGHGFEVILHAKQPLGLQSDGLVDAGALGRGIDYDRLSAIWSPLHAELDHGCLNDLPGLENPTSELLAAWIWQRVKPSLPELSVVSVYETSSAGCHYDGCEFRIWKELRFEGALRLRNAPAQDARRRLHGHSYLLRLHLTAPLDEVLGWTIDYGDVKTLFKPIYKQLDHYELNGLPQLAEPSAAGLARWIRAAVTEVLPQADRLELTERPGCGVLLCSQASAPRQEVVVLPL